MPKGHEAKSNGLVGKDTGGVVGRELGSGASLEKQG